MTGETRLVIGAVVGLVCALAAIPWLGYDTGYAIAADVINILLGMFAGAMFGVTWHNAIRYRQKYGHSIWVGLARGLFID